MARRAARIAGLGQSVFTEFTALAVKHRATNLGQGFPGWPAPEFVKRSAVKAVQSDHNQYAHSKGQPRLRAALAKLYSPELGRTLNHESEVYISCGATAALFHACQAFLGPGDEALLIDPSMDLYTPDVEFTGAKAVRHAYVPKNGTWELDVDALAKKVAKGKTKVLMVNSPHNPSGIVLDTPCLEKIAEVCIENDLICISDEVYDRMVFGDPLPRIASLPGMWERTLTISSAGKTFGVTGWKIGWTLGPPDLVEASWIISQYTAFAISTPAQEAVADALELCLGDGAEKSYFADLEQMYLQKRDKLCAALSAAKLVPMVPQGSFFVLADISAYIGKFPVREGEALDFAFCRWLIETAGIVSIPTSAFCAPEHKGAFQVYARFCFAKTDDVLEEAASKLATMARREGLVQASSL